MNIRQVTQSRRAERYAAITLPYSNRASVALPTRPAAMFDETLMSVKRNTYQRNPIYKTRTKHIGIYLFFVQGLILSIEPVYYY